MVYKMIYVGKMYLCWSKYDINEFSVYFFYGYDVLLCLVVIGCVCIFCIFQEQVYYYVIEYGCYKFYFCIVCYKLLKIQCFESENELLYYGKFEGYCELEFFFV